MLKTDSSVERSFRFQSIVPLVTPAGVVRCQTSSRPGSAGWVGGVGLEKSALDVSPRAKIQFLSSKSTGAHNLS